MLTTNLLRAASALAISAAIAMLGTAAGAAIAPSIPPGTPTQVAALVAAAPSITSIPSNVTPTVANAPNDTPFRATPSLAGCDGKLKITKACSYGDTKSRKTIVLWGDSHAFMWFPAVNAVATQKHWKLVVAYMYGCPVANIAVWNSLTNSPYTQCNTYRTGMIAQINKLHPALLIMSEEFQSQNADKQPITTTQWTAALKSTLGSIKPEVKKVVIGDTMRLPVPDECLAANPTNVQACGIHENNVTYTAERIAEKTAAAARRTKYINVIPWSCSSECTAIIGRMIVYYASGHFTATYDSYLTDVLSVALKSSM